MTTLPHSTPDDAGVDQMLKAYFRHEMPARFPAAPGSVAPAPSTGSWSMMASRFIIGASLVALLLAYMGLSAFFPTSPANGLNPNGTPQIGHNPKPPLVKTVTPER